MCRYLSYLGDSIALEELIYDPSNSLARQAADAMESKTRINADGFGVGWYNSEIHPEPAVFKSLSPLWSDANLRSIAPKVTSSCVLAHVRAARRFDPVNHVNCHPFQYGTLLWMHNGDIPGRGRLHRRVCLQADDSLVARIEGNTDSELAFVLFLSLLDPPLDRRFETEELRSALGTTIEWLVDWWRSDKDTAPLVLNFCLSNGSSIVASRLALGDVEVPTLHYRVASRDCDRGNESCRRDDLAGGAIVSSERLSEESRWAAVDNGQILSVSKGSLATLDYLAGLV